VGHLLAQCHKSPSQFPPFKKLWKRKVETYVVVSEKVMEGNTNARKSHSISHNTNLSVHWQEIHSTTCPSKSTCPN
jgi:hypothetical protein